MHRLIYTLLIASFLCLPLQQSQAWWIFGKKEKEWKKLDPTQQNAMAESAYHEGLSSYQNGDYSDAEDIFEDIYKEYPGSKYAPDSLFLLAKISKQEQDWDKTYAACQRLLTYYPDYGKFDELIQMQFEVAEAYETGKGVKFLWLIPTRNLDRALAIYESVIANAPYSDWAPIALMRVAIIHKMRKKTILAADALDRLINNYPDCLATADAYLQLAETYNQQVDGPEYDQGCTREAISYYQTFMILFKDNPAIARGEKGLEKMNDIHAKSKLVMGEYYFKSQDDYRAAKVFFNQAITLAPESHSANKAREYLNIIDQLDKKFPDGRYPVRNVWQHLKFWGTYNPLDVDAPTPTEEAEPVASAD